MVNLAAMLSARRGRGKADWTDWVSYGYLLLGLVLMFGPVLWLALSSFKSAAALNELSGGNVRFNPSCVPTEGFQPSIFLAAVQSQGEMGVSDCTR